MLRIFWTGTFQDTCLALAKSISSTGGLAGHSLFHTLKYEPAIDLAIAVGIAHDVARDIWKAECLAYETYLEAIGRGEQPDRRKNPGRYPPTRFRLTNDSVEYGSLKSNIVAKLSTNGRGTLTATFNTDSIRMVRDPSTRPSWTKRYDAIVSVLGQPASHCKVNDLDSVKRRA